MTHTMKEILLEIIEDVRDRDEDLAKELESLIKKED